MCITHKKMSRARARMVQVQCTNGSDSTGTTKRFCKKRVLITQSVTSLSFLRGMRPLKKYEYRFVRRLLSCGWPEKIRPKKRKRPKQMLLLFFMTEVAHVVSFRPPSILWVDRKNKTGKNKNDQNRCHFFFNDRSCSC